MLVNFTKRTQLPARVRSFIKQTTNETKRTQFLARVRSFIKQTNTNELPVFGLFAVLEQVLSYVKIKTYQMGSFEHQKLG
ncbi:hypothetical protein Hanom_Chr04g00303561 [Helianthus anomalus]